MGQGAGESQVIETDVLILGQGIAGTCLALALRQRGQDALVVDQADEDGSSWAAGGLVHPLVFKRLTFAWPGLSAMIEAQNFYRREAGVAWREIGLFRRFGSDFERRRWQERISETDYREVLAPLTDPEGDEYGRLLLGGHLEAGDFLRRVRKDLQDRARFFESRVLAHDLDPTSGTLRLPNKQVIRWQRLVLATGIQSPAAGLLPETLEEHSALSRYRDLAYYGVKGETVDFLLPELNLPGAVLGPVFALPLAEPGIVRVGSTYERDFSNPGPTLQGLRELCEDAARILPAYSPAELEERVVRRTGGIRPATRDRKPYVGPLDPGTNSVYCLNGLGTRGFLLAPWLAGQLADHLTDGTPLPQETEPRWKSS